MDILQQLEEDFVDLSGWISEGLICNETKT